MTEERDTSVDEGGDGGSKDSKELLQVGVQPSGNKVRKSLEQIIREHPSRKKTKIPWQMSKQKKRLRNKTEKNSRKTNR